MDYELMMNGNVRIGQKAPDFEAETTFGKIKLEDYKGKWLVLFSHPRGLHPCMYNRNDSIHKSTKILSADKRRTTRTKCRFKQFTLSVDVWHIL